MEGQFVTRNLKDKKLGNVTNYLTVGMAGAAARLAVNPLSTVKIYTEVGAPGSKMGVSRTFYWISKLHGKSAIFTRGALLGAARVLPQYTIQVGVYDRLSSNFGMPPGDKMLTVQSVVTSYFNGACSGIAATLVTHPLDVVKTRMVVQGPVISYKSPVHAFQRIVQTEGFYRGIYRGLGVSLIGSGIFSGSFFMFWELFDNVGWRRRGAAPFIGGRFEPVILPAVAFGTAAIISHPIDILRRKIMAQSEDLPKRGNVDIKFSNVGQAVVNMPKQGNIYAFYGGIVSNMMRIGPQIGVFAVSLWTLQKALTTVLPS